MSVTEAESISLFNFYPQDNIEVPDCTRGLGSSKEKGDKGDTHTESRGIWEAAL